jgi:hypothetical protein
MLVARRNTTGTRSAPTDHSNATRAPPGDPCRRVHHRAAVKRSCPPPTWAQTLSPRHRGHDETVCAKDRSRDLGLFRTVCGLSQGETGYQDQATDRQPAMLRPRPDPRGGLAVEQPAELVEVAPEHLGARGSAPLGYRLGFDLPDPLSGDPVEVADLLQGCAAGRR